MPSIHLRDYEVEEGSLPENCMCCGAPATLHKDRKFSWYPSWVIVIMVLALLPGLIVALVLTKKMRVMVPLCARHKKHWSMRNAITLIGLLLVLVLIFPASMLASEPNGSNLPLIGVLVLFLGWLVTIIVLQSTSIRPTDITPEGITLTGVSREFIEAFDALREEDRERGRRIRDAGGELEPRRPRRLDDDRLRRKNDEEENRYRD